MTAPVLLCLDFDTSLACLLKVHSTVHQERATHSHLSASALRVHSFPPPRLASTADVRSFSLSHTHSLTSMFVRAPVLFYLLAALASVEASVLSRRSETVGSTAGRVHRRGTGFVRDLRLAYSGIRTRRSDSSSDSQKAFCVNVADNDSSLTSGGGPHRGDGAGPASSGTAKPSATSSGAPAASSSAAASSPWKLKQSYVSVAFSRDHACTIETVVVRRKALRSLVAGPSSQTRTRRVALWTT